ncbi:MAG: DUF3473 domain-containing protein [Pirellulales bacterium]|nr:DUF3473 domain-containing protein [Pirellulales bacterium]
MDFLNAFTVDVEDYFQVSAAERHVSRDDWGSRECRVVANTHRILELLASHNVKATFFILGWVANRFPRLVQDIHASGHELGSHGHWHRLVYTQSPDSFRADLRASRAAIEDASGVQTVAYRAASFSITKESLWSLDILREEGFRLDSSVFPVYHDRYGIPNAQPSIHQITTRTGSLWEFPPSVVRWAGMNVPVSGGGYFRLYPLSMTLRMLSRINRRDRRPFMFYVHPWEIDPLQPPITELSWCSKSRHYVNLASTERKLDILLKRFRFGTISDAVNSFQGSNGHSCTTLSN